MAKLHDVRQIVIPRSEGLPDKFRLAGTEQGELSKNPSEAPKTDSGSELTPRSRMSWAYEVEEEHEATGWTGKPRAKVEGQNGAKTEDGAVKKSKKKKKKKSKAGTTAVEVSATPADSYEEDQIGSTNIEVQTDGEGTKETSHPATGKVMSESDSCAGPVHLQLDTSNSPAKATRANGHGMDTDWMPSRPGNADKTSKVAESGSHLHGRSKPGNLSATSIRVTRNQEEPKYESSPRGKLTSASSWEPDGAKDNKNGHGDSEFGDAGWEVARSNKSRRGSETFAKVPEAPLFISNVYVPPPSSNGNWDDDLATADVPSSNGNWDEDLPTTDVPASNWDSGWEVAGPRRNKRADDSQNKSFLAPNFGQRGKGRGQQQGPKSNEPIHRGGNKQRPGDWEKVSRGRSAGNNAPIKGGRPSPRNMARGEGGSVVASPRQPQTQSAWGKPFNKLTHSSSNLSTASLTSAQVSGAASNVKSGVVIGKLLPAERGLPEPNAGNPEFNTAQAPIDAWKGGFPAFSGNGSSVFDDYPGSLYSDSQCSDDDFDSDTMSLASFDSAESHKSHATQRRNKWFRNFFQDLDELTEDELQEHDRQWHCPACQGGVGAIDWYRGLQPLLAHAKTVRSKRVKLHKAFAEVLEEEVRIRGAAPGTHGSGKYGKWRGLGDDNDNKDTLIVWPPMVVIRNTQLEQDEVDKWIGMGNKELLDLFKKHNPVKARHAYGPQGHRGISILIFPESPTGYYDSQRLDKHFRDALRGRDHWYSQGKVLFQPGGDRILYGYMATAEDLDVFNKHSKGKQNLKWEKKSLQEMVLIPMRRIDEENNKVVYLQGQVQREMEVGKTLKKTMSVLMKKLRMREDELKVIRERARDQYKQQEMEMGDMETLYKSKVEQLKQEIMEKEAGLQKVYEDFEQKHLDQCEQLEQRASKIPKDKVLNDEMQQQQTQPTISLRCYTISRKGLFRTNVRS
ncbi:hypothetical protein MPTK1_1g15560 [Marchantia polymorpha subsp. ruderalis]|uniref:XS domain-containing protein n=2 Tax=Marchantia polymorpha TaxID=3197 RepID=A0AAF6AQH9_MARPO|nr:hypothetical protein MARPO_0033s0105 [Marchantia polymorpha]BBM98699.1 hypothetical protein Mp_1g15560 [Marchantia polymorpha subsp. ruderalis]|eukprot:PTQ41708.1 hypothetical protein MARPO_0033s0105 [Marchantia polymorpha]